MVGYGLFKYFGCFFVGFVILIFCWKKIAYLDKHEMIE